MSFFSEALAQAIVSVPAGYFWTGTVAGSALVLLATWRACVHLRRKRLIKDTPTALIRSAAQGYVELQGLAKLMDGELISAPLSGMPCAWYRYRIEHRERSHAAGRRDQNSWRVIDSGVSENLFLLEDATGKCAVDPDGAVVTPSVCNIWFGKTRQPPRPGVLRGWSEVLGLGQIGRDYRYREERIEIGSPIYALGLFRTHGGAATAIDNETDIAAVLRDWKRDAAGMLEHFDRNRDGQIDMEEWQAVRAEARLEVESQGARRAAGPAIDVVGETGDSERPFVLAATSEAELLAHQQRAAFAFAVSALCGALGLYWMISLRLAA